MPKLTTEQKRKMLAVAELIDKGDMAVLQKIIEFQDIIEDFAEKLEVIAPTINKDIVKVVNSFNEAVSNMNSDIEAIQTELKKEIPDLNKPEIEKIKKQLATLVENIKEIKNSIPTIPKIPDIESAKTEMQREIDRVRAMIPELPKPVSDTPEQVREKLETLKDDERLDASAIKGLEDELKTLSGSIKKLAGAHQTPSPVNWARHEEFAMDGVETTVTLAQGVGAAGNAIIVRYQGQTLDMTTHYTVSGNLVTLVGITPEAGTVISVTYWPF